MNAQGIFVGLLMSSIVVVPGCTGTDTGNPFFQPLIVDAHSSNPSDVAIQEDLGGVVVTEAWLSIDEIGLIDSEACGGDASVRIPPIGVADHAAADSLHLDIEVPEASYCALTIPWTQAQAGTGVPDPVVGTSVYLAGTSAAGRAFVLRSALNITTTAPALAGSFALSPDLGGLFLGFDLATWLEGIDLDSAAVDAGGVVRIDDANNASLLATFESNLTIGIELYRDDNGNGKIDGPLDELLAKGQ